MIIIVIIVIVLLLLGFGFLIYHLTEEDITFDKAIIPLFSPTIGGLCSDCQYINEYEINKTDLSVYQHKNN